MTDDRSHLIKRLNAKVIDALRKLLQQEKETREKYGVDNAHKFVPEELKKLLEKAESELAIPKEEESEGLLDALLQRQPGSEQSKLFILLYQAQGEDLRNWENMLTPDVLHELAVTRPVYGEEYYPQRVLKQRSHQPAFAYLTVIVGNEHILERGVQKDKMDQPLWRLDENAIKHENIIALQHNTLGLFVFRDGKLVPHQVA